MKAEFNNNQPIYQQIIDRVLLSIAKGELTPGEKMKSVRDLAIELKVNPNTMQKALAKLEDMGYLYTERTSGRFVTQDIQQIEKLKTRLPTQITTNYIAEMQACGISLDGIVKYFNEALSKGVSSNE